MVQRSWRLSAKLLIVASMATVIGFSAVCIDVMLDMRRGDEALARQALENIGASIEADISRNIELYDLSLRAIARSMALPEINDVSRPIRQLILFDHVAADRHFGAIQVFDADGRLTIDASTLNPPPEDRAGEEYFSVHRDQPDKGLFISRPTLHRGAYAVALSRRITATDGSFLGVVTGSLRFSYFHDLFDRLSLSPDDMIWVLRRDGTIIMRSPFDLDVIGSNLGELPGVKRALSEPGESYSGPGRFDGVARLVVWRDSGRPLVVVVGKSWHSILSFWRMQAFRIGAIMLALVAFVLAATLFVGREIGRRAQAEDRLAEMATTDALTGLCNRRNFDLVIESEWRRALRAKTPISLLMIDADHFKSYNDTFGHQAGDQVLIGIAICISDSVRRAGDCPARYGGEEFAVLMPGLPAENTLKIAEAIRRKVQGWSDEAAPSTVSIGIASMIPTAAMDWPEFVHAADKALYAAKHSGRNCCVLATMPAMPMGA